ncbi:MAG: DUF2235 domain-containing protein [Pseudomonadota bacterium]
MPKNIVILCDGTSNEISSDRTNILRLFGTLVRDDDQIVFYDPGVGTFGAEHAFSWVWRKTTEVLGMAAGWGLDHNVKEAYRFLAETFHDLDPEEGPPRIYVFGFSRGAYTARVLAGFIHAIGLMPPSQFNLLDYAYRAYKRVAITRSRREAAPTDLAELKLYQRVLQAPRPDIEMLGLFDTVSSVFEIGRFGPRRRRHAFTDWNPSVRAIRHAVAIDERRTMFQPQLWRAPPDAEKHDAKEVWFRGVHADVGGGYPDDRSGLAKVALRWMIAESKAKGVAFDAANVALLALGEGGEGGKSYKPPDETAPLNKSMNPAWRVLEFIPRFAPLSGGTKRPMFLGLYIPLSERRVVPEGALIHESVFLRHERLGDGLPPNLPDEREEEQDPRAPADSADLI